MYVRKTLPTKIVKNIEMKQFSDFSAEIFSLLLKQTENGMELKFPSQLFV